MPRPRKVNPTDYKNQFQRDNYDRIAVQVKKGMREQLKQVATDRGYDSLNAYIKHLLEKDTDLNL